MYVLEVPVRFVALHGEVGPELAFIALAPTKLAFRTKRSAEDFAATVEVQKLTGSYIPPSAGRVTVGEFAETWLAGKVNLAASTRARYRIALDKHVLPAFKTTPLSDVTRSAVRDWISNMSENSKPATVHKNTGVLHQVLEQAVQDSRLLSNPAAGAELPKIEHAERRYLTAKQTASLAAKAKDHSTLVFTLAYTGLRFGEAAALQAGAIDLDRARLRVHRSVTEVESKMVFSGPKSNKPRDVPLPAFLAALLKARMEGLSDDALVFPDNLGGPMRLRNLRRGWWDRAVRDSDVSDGLTPHELRHTAASLAITAGANIKTLQRMLGHASAALTLDRYGHLFDDDLGLVAAQLDQLHQIAQT